ncbi:hypothetical protein HDF16_002832 [Granulicella aggregans]|uniref:Uncharacterized protein n=1 Tax=Granulicella aggregans TaxID=474949 RepID=A0A7W8E447_9BACT|nr:hypothetical protein [Granulicella aggregans]
MPFAPFVVSCMISALTESISTQSASAIAEAACAFGIGAPQADDITVLTITRE